MTLKKNLIKHLFTEVNMLTVTGHLHPSTPSLGNPLHWLHYVGQLMHINENDLGDLPCFVLANSKLTPSVMSK